MKKILIMLVGIFLFKTNNGQESSFCIGAAYALPVFKYSVGGMDNSSKGDDCYTYSDASISLGKGINANIGYQHFINDIIGYRISLNYFHGGKASMSEQSDIALIIRTISKDYSSKFISVNPGFTFAYTLGMFRPFINLGLCIGKGYIILDEITEDQVNETPVSVTKLQWKYKGGIFIGPYSGMGLDMKLSDRTIVFTEFKVSNVQYSPSRGKLLEAIENGNDVLDKYTVSQKVIEFTESYTMNDLQLPDESQPSKEILRRYSCGSFSFGLGIRITL